MSDKKKARAYFYIILTVIFWGLSFLSTKVALTVMPPMTIGLVRFAMAVVILFFMKRFLAPSDRMDRHDLLYAAGAGISGVSLYFFFENNGIKLLSASESSIVISSIPVIIMLFDRIVFGTRLSWIKYAGVALSLAGVWIMVSSSLRLTTNAAGYLYMLGAAAVWVVYCFLTKPLFSRHSRITIVYWQSVFGLAGFVPFVIAEIPQWQPAGPVVWLNIAYLGVFCSAAGYYFYAVGLEDLGVTVSSVFLNLIPVVTVIAGFFILGERLTAEQMAGGAIIIAGVYLASLAGSRKRGDNAVTAERGPSHEKG